MICNLHFIFVVNTCDAVVPLVPELAKHTVSAQLLAGDVEDEDDGDGDEVLIMRMVMRMLMVIRLKMVMIMIVMIMMILAIADIHAFFAFILPQVFS